MVNIQTVCKLINLIPIISTIALGPLSLIGKDFIYELWVMEKRSKLEVNVFAPSRKISSSFINVS